MSIVNEEFRYQAGGAMCSGYLAYDQNRKGPRPGVLIVHEWWGHNEYVRRRARMLAELGYTAFALDMYGDGKSTDHPKDARKFSREVFANMPAGVARFEAAREILENHESTDPSKTAAIGYCFGGAIVLGMARKGADLDAVASFHGSLATEQRAKPNSVKARVLICHGGRDEMVPTKQVAEVEEEMVLGGCPAVKTVIYPDAMHGFTNRDATAKGKQFDLPMAYSADADAASWQELEALLREAFQ
ncbi:MAG: dienelactone hydrolase family protein [Planctomycetota bacterium]